MLLLMFSAVAQNLWDDFFPLHCCVFSGDITFVEPSRRFIHQGQLTKVCRASDRRYTFFLFSDLLVYASKGYRYKLHMKIPIGHLFHFDDLPNSAVENAFQVQCFSYVGCWMTTEFFVTQNYSWCHAAIWCTSYALPLIVYEVCMIILFMYR